MDHLPEPWETMKALNLRKPQRCRSLLEMSVDPSQTNASGRSGPATGSNPVCSAWVRVHQSDCCQPGGSDLPPSTFIHSFSFRRISKHFFSSGDRKGLGLGSSMVKRPQTNSEATDDGEMKQMFAGRLRSQIPHRSARPGSSLS